MRLVMAAVGRLKGAEQDLVERYAERLAGAGRTVALGPLGVIEIAESRHGDASARKVDEGQRLIKSEAGRADVRIALEVTGKSLTSEAFAALLGRSRDEGAQSLAFLIGGPDGHGDAVLGSARYTLSLGPLTLPHGLARVVLAEQVYRAATILAGHPYHRG